MQIAKKYLTTLKIFVILTPSTKGDKMKRTSIMYKGKAWEVNSQLKCNEANMERYRVIYGRTSMTCKIDIYSGQVIKEVV